MWTTDTNRRRRRRKRDAIYWYKATHPCVDCGETDYVVLQFDHVGQKSFTVTQHISDCSYKTILAEIQKCDVVCGNCHLRRTWKLRQKE